MSADPQSDPNFEDDLIWAFARAAEGVRPETELLLAGGVARGRTRRRRRTAAVVGSVTALTLVGAGGVLAASLRSPVVPTSSALTEVRKSAPPHLDRSVNVLLIGLDSRKDVNGNDLPSQFVQDELHAGSSSDIGGYNTDTLVVLHIPANGGQVTALSIPRDDYVQMVGADGKMHKIKEAYGIAKAMFESENHAKGLSKADLEKQSREAGRKATLATVQGFLGVPIDHFAEVNLMGFYDIAQAVGPIQVCLRQAVKDPAMTGQGSGADFTAGINTLNASQALSFVRQRHNLVNPTDQSDFGDFARTHRQQAFLSSVLTKLKGEGVIGDLGKLQSLYDVVKKDLVIDDQWNVVDFVQQASSLTSGKGDYLTLPIAGFATINGQDVAKVDSDQIKRIVKQVFGDAPAPAPAATPGAGSSSATTAVPDPVAGVPQVGPPVQANGIPCVN